MKNEAIMLNFPKVIEFMAISPNIPLILDTL